MLDGGEINVDDWVELEDEATRLALEQSASESICICGVEWRRESIGLGVAGSCDWEPLVNLRTSSSISSSHRLSLSPSEARMKMSFGWTGREYVCGWGQEGPGASWRG